MNVLERLDQANEAIREVDARLVEAVAGRADDGAVSRPAKIHPLPKVDLGTREGCDRTLVHLGRRIQQLEEIDDGGEVAASRDRALSICRTFADELRAHRANLGAVE